MRRPWSLILSLFTLASIFGVTVSLSAIGFHSEAQWFGIGSLFGGVYGAWLTDYLLHRRG